MSVEPLSKREIKLREQMNKMEQRLQAIIHDAQARITMERARTRGRKELVAFAERRGLSRVDVQAAAIMLPPTRAQRGGNTKAKSAASVDLKREKKLAAKREYNRRSLAKKKAAKA